MVLRTIATVAKVGLLVLGLVTLAFIVVSYGWNGEPPTVELE